MAKKQKGPERYAFVGLLIALLGCVGSAVAGLVLGAYKLNLFPTLQPGHLNTYLYAALAVLVAGICIYGILDPDQVRRFLSGRQARYGSNAVITAAAFIGILIVVNLLAFQNPWKIVDATEDKQNTLAPETLQALATLPGKVDATAFYSSRLSPETAQRLLQNFKTNSQGKFDYRFVDPETDPLAARQAGVTGDGKILLTLGDHKEIASNADETELTRSLIRLISPNPRAVYFLTGHGEPELEGSGDGSLSIAKQTLESKNYTVKPLNLISAGQIPGDALAVIIAGPRKPLLDSEVALLRTYVNKGGSLVVMEDPVIFTEFADAPDPLAAYLAGAWGIQLDNDVVIDLENSQNLLQAISDPRTRANHPITQNMTINYLVILPQARSLSLTSQPDGVTQTPLIFTTENSWGESQFTSAEGSKVSFDASQGDIQGPLNLAIAAENANTTGRVVVFGNSIFATDGGFDAYGNGNIFINSVDWAAEQENLIQITPRQSIERTFNPPGSPAAAISLLLGPIFVIPGLILAAGVSSWVARRRRG
jgi:ABC-type uncharacterized transport system involved in gliding motility auxiliary subunit